MYPYIHATLSPRKKQYTVKKKPKEKSFFSFWLCLFLYLIHAYITCMQCYMYHYDATVYCCRSSSTVVYGMHVCMSMHEGTCMCEGGAVSPHIVHACMHTCHARKTFFGYVYTYLKTQAPARVTISVCVWGKSKSCRSHRYFDTETLNRGKPVGRGDPSYPCPYTYIHT